MSNPLLIGRGLPPFDQIQPEHVVPAVQQLLEDLQTTFSSLETTASPTWTGVMEPLEAIGERLRWSWGIIGHLMGVKNSPELREAYETVQPELVQFANTFSQSQPIYRAIKGIREADTWSSLSAAQQRIVETAIRDAELAGVGLEGEVKARFNAIQLELAELGTRFSNNVLDATKAFGLVLDDPADVEGIPSSWLNLAAQAAKAADYPDATAEAGPWRVSLDGPSFGPFLQHCRQRHLRETVYRAYVRRAALGEYDNTALIQRILELRQEKATILGLGSFAELSLASKMAPSVAAVDDLLEELRVVAYPKAEQELAQLQAYANEHNQAEPLKPWDVAFWSERLRETTFAFTDEELRPYFPLNRVLDGLFGLVERLFEIKVIAADGEAPIWHPDVRYFRIENSQGVAVANFYLDPYSRPADKRGGAWMDECVTRRLQQGEVRLPVAYLICNQTPPVGDRPSLMSFREVETLFHEFGHGLQHMLTTVDFSGAAGINNVEWDAVELPSQFMENWCYDRATLMGMARHYETGEPLPEHYYQKLLAAKTFMSGLGTLRQVYFSAIDIELHHRYTGEPLEAVRDRIAAKATVLPPLPEDAFLCAFGHIFAGGYAAGYYSYKWAEVLSADAFAAFEEAGLEDANAIASTGQRFRDTVLSLGGSQHPLAVFAAFRGREPSTEALMRHSGLKA